MMRYSPPHPTPRSILLLRAVAVVTNVDRFAMPPLLVTIAARLDARLSDVVHATGAYFLAYALMQPLWAAVSDRFGRVLTLRVTLAMGGTFGIASAFSDDPTTMVLTRGLTGAFYAAAYPTALTYLGDTVPLERRQREVAGLMVGVAVGMGTASAGAGLLAETLSWRLALVVPNCLAVALALMLSHLPEPARGSQRPRAIRSLIEVSRSPTTLVVLALVACEGLVMLGALTLLPAAIESSGRTAATAGIVTAGYAVAVLVSAKLVGPLSQRWPEAALVAIGGASAVAACGLLALSRSPLTAAAAAALLGVAWASMHSSLQTWATAVLPAARATVVSLSGACLFLGNAACTLLMGGLADRARYADIYLILALFGVPLAIAATVGRARGHRGP